MPEDLAEGNLIITMGALQRQKILETYEEAAGAEIYVLTELVGDELEIIDPYGGSLQLYGLCYETLNKSIQKLVRLLEEGLPG